LYIRKKCIYIIHLFLVRICIYIYIFNCPLLKIKRNPWKGELRYFFYLSAKQKIIVVQMRDGVRRIWSWSWRHTGHPFFCGHACATVECNFDILLTRPQTNLSVDLSLPLDIYGFPLCLLVFFVRTRNSSLFSSSSGARASKCSQNATMLLSFNEAWKLWNKIANQFGKIISGIIAFPVTKCGNVLANVFQRFHSQEPLQILCTYNSYFHALHLFK